MTVVSRRRSTLQILLLSAGFFVLVAVSVASVLLVNKAREDNAWVIHTVETDSQIANLLLDIRRAESATRGISADISTTIPVRVPVRGSGSPGRAQPSPDDDRG
ncbi:hypothetical protein ACVIM9_001668 [Bradyrhizobium sp. USDA 4520]